MELPQPVRLILNTLWQAGYEAQVVGGCVRDTLMGRKPHDWDICTSAFPEETRDCFANCQVVDTGLKHGTVTIVLNHEPYEVTTYRADGVYSDHRRPDQVRFVRSLKEDLARRDFTINAMAYSEQQGLEDEFGGQEDLAGRVIRCVGDPAARFQEDALRILRALRFAAVLDFDIDPDTARAAREEKELLRHVSAERIYVELDKLLCGPGAGRVLAQFPDVVGVVIPEILPCVGFDQRNPCHDKDVWMHTLAAVDYAPADHLIRWTLLLHDLGKPACFSQDENGVGHFYGHPAESVRLAKGIFHRLKVEKKLKDTACKLIAYHDAMLPRSRKGILHWLNRFGEEWLRTLLIVRRCDSRAHADAPKMRIYRRQLEEFAAGLGEVLAEDACFSLRDLAVTGTDVIACGVAPGPQVGKVLRQLLERVMDGECPNEREALLNCLRNQLEEE